MARLFPNNITGTISPEVAKVLHGLRRIPGDEVLVWIKLPLLPSPACQPDLMVIDRDRSCYLIAVSTLSETSVQTAVHGDLFATKGGALKPEEIGAGEERRLSEFRRTILHAPGEAVSHLPPLNVHTT